uniref:Ephrin-A4 n=1 Tax=Scleropages formosus TaxID=113540 RepID=A0A8C9VGL3_SCLFO
MGGPWARGRPAPWRLALLLLLQVVSAARARRHALYWNSTNARLVHGDFSIQVNISDYLDIYCPHYPPDAPTANPPETLILYLVGERHFQGCVETTEVIKRWECSQPYAPYGPVRFSEKIQRFTPFSLGFEFLPGHSYYYMSLPTVDGPRLPCLTLRVTVCCESGTPAPRGAACGVMKAPLPLFLILPVLLLLPV